MGSECKSRKSGDTLNYKQMWPWSTEWSREKANRVLSREHVGHSKQPFPTIQETILPMNITRWSITKSDYVFGSQRWRSSIQSVKIKTWSWVWLSDHELLIAKFRLKLNKVGKTTRTFSYNLNQIPFDYTVEVTNRFKGLDLVQSAWRIMDRDL